MKTLLTTIALVIASSVASANVITELVKATDKIELHCTGSLYNNFEYIYDIETEITIYTYEDKSKVWITTGANLFNNQYHNFEKEDDNPRNMKAYITSSTIRGEYAYYNSSLSDRSSIYIDRHTGRFSWFDNFESESLNSSYRVSGTCYESTQKF